MYGRADGFPATLDVQDLANGDGEFGFTMLGGAGLSVDSAGDVNGDGLDDMLVSTSRSNNYEARAYLVYGAPHRSSPVFDLPSLASGDGTLGTVIVCWSGDPAWATSSAGDFNGDGFDDLLLGDRLVTYHVEGDGIVVVLYGQAEGLGNVVDVAAIDAGDGTGGFVVHNSEVVPGVFAGLGAWVDDAGDVNGDGLDDILIGSSFAHSTGGMVTATGFVVYGRRSGVAGRMDLAGLDAEDGSRGTVLVSNRRPEGNELVLAAGGDVDGDGIRDIAVGSPPYSNTPGAAYVLYGSVGGLGPSVQLSDLSTTDGRRGFEIVFSDDLQNPVGSSVGAADFDGDGFDDLLVAHSAVTASAVAVVFAVGDRPQPEDGAWRFGLRLGLDNDSDRDLAITNSTSRNLSVLRNLGDGTFQSPDNFGVANFPPALSWAVAAADLDEDGDQDLAVANGSADTISVLTNVLMPGAYRLAAQGDETLSRIDFGVRPINHPPMLDEIPDPAAIAEDAGEQTVLLAGISAGAGESQPLRVLAASDNPALLSDITVEYQSPQDTGQLRFRAGEDRYGTAIVTVTVFDAGLDGSWDTAGDNASMARRFTVTVTAVNDAPAISEIADQTAEEGQVVGPLAFTLADPETPAGELVITIASDNPTLIPDDRLVLAGSGPSRTLPITPATGQRGAATITVTVSDGSLSSSETFRVMITAVGVLEIADFTPSTTGFSVGFSRDLDAATLNLYDQGNLLGAADVRVIGATLGAVRGSLVVDPALRKVTFIKTDGVLEADIYTVTLVSGATAFRDTNGNSLDGDGNTVPGGDYVTTFVVEPRPGNEVTVSLPDFARGFGQPVNLPANVATAGVPITLSNGLGVSGLDLQLHWNPELLNFQGFTLDPALAAAGAQVLFTEPTAGRGLLTISAASSLSATSGPLTLGTFTAHVPDTAPYGAKHVLDIVELHVYDDGPEPAELPAVDDDAIHVAAFFGDNNGSRGYNAPDVTLVQRLIGQINTGMTAYQLADPRLLADITRNNLLQANDTASLQRVIGQVPVANVPALPSGITPPAASGADPTIYIPQDLSGSPGDSVAVPVRLRVTEAEGITLSGFDLTIEFDPTRFTVSDARLGSLVEGHDFSGLWTSPAPGQLIYTASSATGSELLPAGTEGSLVVLTLTVGASTAAGATPLNLLASYQLTATAAFDNGLNELLLTPAPTNAATDSVDGLLTVQGYPSGRPPGQNPDQPLDTNNDGEVTPADVLAVINYLNSGLPQDASVLYVEPGRAVTYGDVNGDRRITAQDVLAVVNHLNARVAAGEGASREAALSALVDDEERDESLWELLAEARLRPRPT